MTARNCRTSSSSSSRSTIIPLTHNWIISFYSHHLWAGTRPDGPHVSPVCSGQACYLRQGIARACLNIKEFVGLFDNLHPHTLPVLPKNWKQFQDAMFKIPLPNFTEDKFGHLAGSDFRVGKKLCNRWRKPYHVRKPLNDYQSQLEDLCNRLLKDIRSSCLKLFSDSKMDQVAIMSYFLRNVHDRNPTNYSWMFSNDLQVIIRWKALGKKNTTSILILTSTKTFWSSSGTCPSIILPRSIQTTAHATSSISERGEYITTLYTTLYTVAPYMTNGHTKHVNYQHYIHGLKDYYNPPVTAFTLRPSRPSSYRANVHRQ